MKKAQELSCRVSDNDLIRKIQETGDNDSYLELRARYENAYYSMCHRYLKSCVLLGIKEQDILENMDYVLFNSARTFDFSRKLKFSTWISNQARYFCLNSMRRSKRNLDNFNLALNTSEINTDEDNILEHELSKLTTDDNSDAVDHLKFILNEIKDEKAVTVIKLRYQNKRKTSWDTISKKIGISYESCKLLHDMTLSDLRKKMNIDIPAAVC